MTTRSGVIYQRHQVPTPHLVLDYPRNEVTKQQHGLLCPSCARPHLNQECLL